MTRPNRVGRTEGTTAEDEGKAGSRMSAAEIRMALASGQSIVGARVFPHPLRFYLCASMGAAETGQYRPQDEISMAKIRGLVTHGHIQHRPLDAAWDHLVYTLTPKGVVAARDDAGQPK